MVIIAALVLSVIFPLQTTLTIIGLILFMFGYGFGYGPVSWVYYADVLPGFGVGLVTTSENIYSVIIGECIQFGNTESYQ